MFEATDAGLLGDALVWAAETPAAYGETFNVTNGDVFVLHDAWEEIARFLSLEASFLTGRQACRILCADERSKATWHELAAQNRLAIGDLGALLGQSHHYVDMLLDERMVQRGSLPILVSSIKIRQAGFGACRDSLESMLTWLRRMANSALLPPVPGNS